MSNADDTSSSVIEREFKNELPKDREKSLATLNDDLQKIAEETDAEYVLVRVEPMDKEQHEANEALRKLVLQRSNELADTDTRRAQTMTDGPVSGTNQSTGTRIEAPNLCPNGETDHLVEMGPGVLRCLNCSFNSSVGHPAGDSDDT